MKKQSWEKLFTPTILSRGRSYYKEGCVEDLYFDSDTDTLSATVQGSYPYDVEIYFDSDMKSAYDMSCDCPYAEDGSYCKHMAAVLYEFSEQKELKIQMSKAATASLQEESHITIEEAVNMLSESEAKEYLLECARQDEDLRDRIMLHTQPNITYEQQKQWKRELKKLLKPPRYEDYYDYYEDSEDDCDHELEDFLSLRVPILLEKKLVKEAFDLLCMAYIEYSSRGYDLFDEWHSELSFVFEDHFISIIEAADPALKREFFKWFEDNSDDDILFGIMNQVFEEEEYLTRILAVVDSDIDHASASDEQLILSLVQCRCSLMERLHISDGEQQAFRRKFFHVCAIRKAEVKWLESKRQFKEAIALARESREIDSKHDQSNKYSWTRCILELLRQTKNVDEYKRELCEYVLEDEQSDLHYVFELRRIESPENWPALRDEILQSGNLKLTLRLDFLCDEKLYDRLFDELMTSRSPAYVWLYEKPLREHYPFEMLDVLTRLINNEMASATSRENYKAVISKLSIISSYPNGKAEAEQIAYEWTHKYARRKAMLEELRKVGYHV